MLNAPAAERNQGPILAVLRECVDAGKPLRALEVSSGTGQHVAHFAQALRNITWQPSEYDHQSLASIEAYRVHYRLDTVKPAIHLDASLPCETWGSIQPESLDLVVNINMIHISPVACTEGLFKGAGQILKPQGILLTYGPYAVNGQITPESNVNFDYSLRQRNPAWGLRDISLLSSMAQKSGLFLEKVEGEFGVRDLPACGLLVDLKQVISAVKRDLAQEDNATFLASYELTQTSARHLCSRPDPQLLPGGLVDVAKHLGNLSFRVWEKMREECIKFTPVILDPNTAAITLYLSDDLTSVRRKTPAQDHPDNPERFVPYAELLGSEGFISGKHCWEVEVGDHPHWLTGVSKESVDRKGQRNAAPENGFWCLFYRSERYTNGSGKRLTLKKIPQRIRVVLDCDRGEVSFYNPEGNDHIYTHEATFSEKIYPFFYAGQAGETQTSKVSDQKVM